MTRRLADAQLAAFDTEYVSDPLWDQFRASLIGFDPGGPLRILDVGGGNGLFADRLLDAFPNSHVVVLEPSLALLSKNVPHERKLLVQGGAEMLGEEVLPFEQFDLICFNWVLHHLVEDSYTSSLAAQSAALRAAASLLSHQGTISIFENGYEPACSYAPSPGAVIYGLTSSKRLAWLIRLAGSNTAGVGVLFRALGSWKEALQLSGLEVAAQHRFESWRFGLIKRICLNIGDVRTIHICARLALASGARA